MTSKVVYNNAHRVFFRAECNFVYWRELRESRILAPSGRFHAIPSARVLI